MVASPHAASILEKLFNKEFRPLYSREARKLWEEAQKNPRESWAMALFRHCDSKVKRKKDSESDEILIDDTIFSILYEVLHSRQNLLTQNEHLCRALATEDMLERAAYARKALKKFFTYLKDHLISEERSNPGTFAHTYRSVQQILSKSADNTLHIYEKYYYGPAGLDDQAPKIDVMSGEITSIALPQWAPPLKHLFTTKQIRPLSQYFHRQIYAAQGFDAASLVSIRNFVYWLCGKYEILDRLAEPKVDEDGQELEILPDDIQTLAQPFWGHEARNQVLQAAEKLTLRLSEDEKCLYALLHVEQATGEEAAQILGLHGPSGVQYRQKKLYAAIRTEMLQYEQLAPDDEHAAPFVDIFFQRLGELCKPCLERRKGEQAPTSSESFSAGDACVYKRV